MLSLSDQFESNYVRNVMFNLEHSPFKFFGGYTPLSDWNFYAQDSEELRKFLFDLGFKNARIHIQLVKSLERKRKAKLALKRHTCLAALEKPVRKQLWALAYALTA